MHHSTVQVICVVFLASMSLASMYVMVSEIADMKAQDHKKQDTL